jgi:hypothetical protein
MTTRAAVSTQELDGIERHRLGPLATGSVGGRAVQAVLAIFKQFRQVPSVANDLAHERRGPAATRTRRRPWVRFLQKVG